MNRPGPIRRGGRAWNQQRDQRSSPTTQHPLAAEGWRLVLGQQPVREVVRVWSTQTHQVLVEDKDNHPRLDGLRTFAEDQGIDVQRVSRAELDRLAGGGKHQGAAAWAPPLPLVAWSVIREQPQLLAVALDGVVDPQNFGAAIRSAVGIASSPILWAESSSAPLTPATFRASAGAVEHAQLCRVRSLHGTLADAVAHGIEVIGLSPDAPETLHRAPPDGPCIIVIGSEEKGMARAVRRTCTRLVRLGQSGKVQSLNASVAAGIALHCVMAARDAWQPPEEAPHSIE